MQVSDSTSPADPDLGKDLPVGERHYRAFVGPPDKYDVVSAMQFNLLTALGLREDHSLLDVGCGSLRAGRLCSRRPSSRATEVNARAIRRFGRGADLPGLRPCCS